MTIKAQINGMSSWELQQARPSSMTQLLLHKKDEIKGLFSIFCA